MIELKRISSTDKGTFGALLIDQIPVCVTCEDPWNDNQSNISCIPSGTYQCSKFSGSKFTNVWMLKDVPDRNYILIHAGNTIDDTHGCILVGRSFSMLGSLPSVMQSKEALDILRGKLPDEFSLTITNH